MTIILVVLAWCLVAALLAGTLGRCIRVAERPASEAAEIRRLRTADRPPVPSGSTANWLG